MGNIVFRKFLAENDELPFLAAKAISFGVMHGESSIKKNYVNLT